MPLQYPSQTQQDPRLQLPGAGSASDLYLQYGAYGAPGSAMSGLQKTSGVMGTAGDVGLASANPYGMIAGGILKAGQFGLNAYSAYNEQARQEAALRELKKEQERQRQIAEEERRYRKYLDRLTQAQNIGQYSQGLEDRSLQDYTKFVT